MMKQRGKGKLNIMINLAVMGFLFFSCHLTCHALCYSLLFFSIIYFTSLFTFYCSFLILYYYEAPLSNDWEIKEEKEQKCRKEEKFTSILLPFLSLMTFHCSLFFFSNSYFFPCLSHTTFFPFPFFIISYAFSNFFTFWRGKKIEMGASSKK